MELPKKKKRLEASVDGLVLEWLLKNYDKSFALEVKVKGGTLLPHQEAALKKVERGKFGYKIPDQGRRNPFDCVGLINADALVCMVDGREVTCIVNNNHNISFKI